MRARHILALTAAAAAVVVVAGCAAEPQAAPSTGGTPANGTEAAAYCAEQGGVVQTRQPSYGTNNAQDNWVALGERVDMCRFTADDDSRIYVDLNTLHSRQPSLAALAYLQASIPRGFDPTANPAAEFCDEIGGTSQFGPGANGGGYVNVDDLDDEIVAACVFADGSFIDEWGIMYHVDGTVRGKDLATVFRFDANTAPHVFD